MKLETVVGVLGIFVALKSGETAESKANLNSLRVAQVIFRHGSRSIDVTYPTDPYKDESYWAPGYSQVNNEGKLQAYELGIFLRERYDKFVKETYDLKDLYVLSSDYSRTIQTASAVLAGFYLPNEPIITENQTVRDAISKNEVEVPLHWKSVPVHTIPEQYDNMIRQLESICPRYYQDLLANIDAFPGKEDRDKAYEIVGKELGVEVTSYFYYARLYDALVVEEQRNLTLPPWTDAIFKTGLGQRVFSSYFHFLHFTTERRRLRVGPLLGRLVENMQKNQSHFDNEFLRSTSGQKKMYMFSGHDATLFSILYTLGIYNGKRAKYCSALMLELHQKNESDPSDLSIEVYYRNETERDPYQLIIPECGHPCSFQRFRELVDPYIPLDWEKECQIFQGSDTLSTGEFSQVVKGWIVAIVLIVWVVLFLVLQYWLNSSGTMMRCCKERKKRSYSQLL